MRHMSPLSCKKVNPKVFIYIYIFTIIYGSIIRHKTTQRWEKRKQDYRKEKEKKKKERKKEIRKAVKQ